MPSIIEEFKADIAAALSAASGVPAEAIVPALESCKKPELGAFAVAVPRLSRLSSDEATKKMPPAQVAKVWAEAFKPTELVESVNVAGVYLNFKLKTPALARRVCEAVEREGTEYGKNKSGEGRTVVVEYSSPNIAKPFHAGHLRSTVLGNFLCNIHKANGYRVVGINWLGDWGVQFGKLAVGFEKWGDDEKLKTEPLRHLYEVYVKVNKACEEDKELDKRAHEFFQRMEQGDKEALAVWNRFRDLSIADLNKTYARLNIHFDEISGESQMNQAIADEAMQTLKEKGLLVEDAGALIVPLKPYGLTNAILKKSDDTTLYLTRDLAAAIERHRKYHFDRMFYVVSAQQSLHFQQLFKTLELMGHDWASKCVHTPFGMVKGMSTRKGTAVFLDDILAEAQQTMYDIMTANAAKLEELDADPRQVSDVVGVSAVVAQDFNARRIKDYDFNWKRMTSFEGHTGPYLEYAHARLCSLERKCGFALNPAADLSLVTEPEAAQLLFEVARFPEVVKEALESLEPVTVLTYLFKLSSAISVAHGALWVKDRERPLAEARLLVYHVARVTLGNGLRLLGLTPLERM